MLKLHCSLWGKKLLVILLFSSGMLVTGAWLIAPTSNSKVHKAIPHQQATLWTVPFYAIPGGNDGTAITAFTGKVPDICNDDAKFFVEYKGAKAPIETQYNGGIYTGHEDDFFPPGTNIEVADIEIVCGSPALETPPLIIRRYFVDNTEDTTITAEDGNAQLILNENSLNVDKYIIVMPTNALFQPFPEGIKIIGEPYSLGASGADFSSDGDMIINLFYPNTGLGEVNPLTLRIFKWIAADDEWRQLEGFPNPVNESYLSQTTKNFTTYILVSTPHWLDRFTSTDGIDADTRMNITLLTGDEGRLELDNKSMPGMALSLPYTPTLTLESWNSISYTAIISNASALTVTVLALDNTPLITNVVPGQALTSVNPNQYPSLKLKVEMDPAPGKISPQLLDWSILADVKLSKVYLPLVIK